MALFGGKRSLLESVLASGWNNPTERQEMLAGLRQAPPKPVEAVPLLWHTDPEVRKLGAELFLARPDGAAVGHLISELARKPPAVRTAIQPFLRRLPAPAVGPAMDSLLDDGSPELRRTAWEMALTTPEPLRSQYLERALTEAPAALRLKAVQELVQAGTVVRHLDALVNMAEDPDRQVSQQALNALAAVDHPRVLEVMLERLAEGDETSQKIAGTYLRNASAKSPEKLREVLLDSLSRGNQNTRRIAVEVLLESGDAKAVTLAVLRRCEGLAGWLRRQILEALASGGEPVLAAAVALMQHEDPEVRTGAIMMLADGFEDRRLLEPFCRLLKDPDWWLRVTACQVLGNLGDERAVAPLVATLEDEDTRWAAVDALAQIGAASALQPLSKLLRDPREEVRLEVLQAFSRFSDQRLLPVVQSVRDKDPSPAVQRRAGEILVEMSERLNVGVPQAGAPGAKPELENPLDKLLLRVREMGASDLHLTVGEPPMVRVDGVLRRMEGLGKLSAEHSQRYVTSLLNEAQRDELDSAGALDFCHEIPGVGRYRANAFVQRLGTCASFRVIADTPPTLSDLGLPDQLKELTDYHQGVILISGPAGCGKSTTLAALVNLINESKAVHVITLEDPIEVVHPPKLALVNQREVGRDTTAFATGLRAALREDPDVVVVGELRDLDTVRMALEAAETGHVVITTLHTMSAVQTIDRLVDSFPPDEQAQVRTSLSESLKYIVCQRLLPRKDGAEQGPGKGRVACFEVIRGTLSIGNKIRKRETFQIPGLMQIGRHLGMRTRDQALAELLGADLITTETALRYAEKPENFSPSAAAGSARGGPG